MATKEVTSNTYFRGVEKARLTGSGRRNHPRSHNGEKPVGFYRPGMHLDVSKESCGSDARPNANGIILGMSAFEFLTLPSLPSLPYIEIFTTDIYDKLIFGSILVIWCNIGRYWYKFKNSYIVPHRRDMNKTTTSACNPASPLSPKTQTPL